MSAAIATPGWIYAPLAGGVVVVDGSPAPTPPANWKQQYYAIPIDSAGSEQGFQIPNLRTNYDMECDALLQFNGVFLHPNDYAFIVNDLDVNFVLHFFCTPSDWVSFEPILSAKQPWWLQEFYWDIENSGANQIYFDRSLSKGRDTRTNFNTNLSKNGVLMSPLEDYSYQEGVGITISAYLLAGDTVGILPTCAGRLTGTPLVPIMQFSTTKNAANQTFINPLLAQYVRSDDLILVKDGVVLQPTTDYALAGSTLTVNAYMRAFTELIVLANARSYH